MTTFRIKLVETSTTEGTAEFAVAATNAEAAAAMISAAYRVARAQNIAVLTLSDGQSSVVERSDVIERETRFVLLDDDGSDLQTIVPQEATSGAH